MRDDKDDNNDCDGGDTADDVNNGSGFNKSSRSPFSKSHCNYDDKTCKTGQSSQRLGKSVLPFSKLIIGKSQVFSACSYVYLHGYTQIRGGGEEGRGLNVPPHPGLNRVKDLKILI